MTIPTALVITTISPPNRCLRDFAEGSREHDYYYIVIGDKNSPQHFVLPDCDYYDIERQLASGLKYAAQCPTGHYARKNVGYLLAMRRKVEVIIESDDDNIPLDAFWERRRREYRAAALSACGWTNVYRYFSDTNIWPRGLPLDAIHTPVPHVDEVPAQTVDCPIQQGLANDNPDVDAIYRLIMQVPHTFRNDRSVALRSGAWCPFNSQNTTWFRDAFPLLYLPAYCSFRMTDIWRSFIAQRVAWANDWGILFHKPTVRQDRNDHNLLRDFEDEIPGYLHNRSIAEHLDRINLRPGREYIAENLVACYEALVNASIFEKKELALLDAWLADING